MNRYKAIVGERELSIDLNADEVLVDGKQFSGDYRVLGDGRIHIIVDGRSYSALLQQNGEGLAEVSVEGIRSEVLVKTDRDLLLEKYGMDTGQSAGHADLKSPMPGLVVRIAVSEGDTVDKGDPLLVLEAMKMENELKAESAGSISSVHVAEGDAVTKGQLLIEIDAES